jgi:hypothetical protein
MDGNISLIAESKETSLRIETAKLLIILLNAFATVRT